MSDTDHTIQMLRVCDPLRVSVLRSAIRTLQLPSGSQGLDAGCGIGLQAQLLAEAVGPAGQIIGLDLSSKLLAYAEQIVDQAGLSEQISFLTGDVHSLPFDEAPIYI